MSSHDIQNTLGETAAVMLVILVVFSFLLYGWRAWDTGYRTLIGSVITFGVLTVAFGLLAIWWPVIA